MIYFDRTITAFFFYIFVTYNYGNLRPAIFVRIWLYTLRYVSWNGRQWHFPLCIHIRMRQCNDSEIFFRVRKSENETKARPIVVKFSDATVCDYVRSFSSRFKGSKFGISPHYTRETWENGKKTCADYALSQGGQKESLYQWG